MSVSQMGRLEAPPPSSTLLPPPHSGVGDSASPDGSEKAFPGTLTGMASDDFLRVNGSLILSLGSSQKRRAGGIQLQGTQDPMRLTPPAEALGGTAARKVSLGSDLDPPPPSRMGRQSRVLLGMWAPFLRHPSTRLQQAGLEPFGHPAARSPTLGLWKGRAEQRSEPRGAHGPTALTGKAGSLLVCHDHLIKLVVRHPHAIGGETEAQRTNILGPSS